jgi:hypothetical protein
VVLLSGCVGEPHPAGTGTATAATYTADDLVDILDRTGTELGVDGQLITDQQLKDAAGKLGGASGLTDLLGMSEVTYSPEGCGTRVADALAGGVPRDAIAAQFRAGATAVTAASFAGEPLTSSQKSAWTATARDALEECGTMTMSFEVQGTRSTATITTKKTAVRTSADETSSLEQTMLITSGRANTAVVSTVVLAVAGNLLITATTTRTDQTSDVEAQQKVVSPSEAVDAVVSVARNGWRR